jgi:biotin carboxylase
MSKLLIIGASILQLPAIIKAKELGHYVAVADYNPQAIGIQYADEYFNASTIDAGAICNIARKFRPDGIMTLATDMPMRSIAAATTLLDLPGISIETAIKSTDKSEMIKAFEEQNVEAPWYYTIENEFDLQKIKNKLTYPSIFKPTDNSGSRGVVLVKNAKTLNEAYLYSKQSARNGNVIIEEYLEGPEVSVEVMVVNGIANILAVTDKLTTGTPHFVEMGHSQPSQLGEEKIVLIKNLAERAVKAVGINNGPAHVEIIVTQNGPKMVELGARMGGDCITTHLVPLSTGIDMVKASIDVSLGIFPDIKPSLCKGSAIRYLSVPNGIINDITGVDEGMKMQGIKEITLTKKIGNEVKEINSSVDRVGYVIAQSNNSSHAISLCEQAIHKIEITTT